MGNIFLFRGEHKFPYMVQAPCSSQGNFIDSESNRRPPSIPWIIESSKQRRRNEFYTI